VPSGPAFGAGIDDLRPAGFTQDGPTGFFDSAAETGFAVAAVVEFADAEAGGRNRASGFGRRVLGGILGGWRTGGSGWGW